jgi:hypothetical protein
MVGIFLFASKFQPAKNKSTYAKQKNNHGNDNPNNRCRGEHWQPIRLAALCRIYISTITFQAKFEERLIVNLKEMKIEARRDLIDRLRRKRI